MVVARVALVRGFHRVRLHRLGRGEIVGEIEQVDEVAAPVGEHAAARFPVGTPTAGMEVFAVGQRRREGTLPEIPVHRSGHGLGWGHRAPRVHEIHPAAHPARPDVGLDRSAETSRLEQFDSLHPARGAGALIAHLGVETGPRLERFADDAEFVELLHERLLSIDVFPVLQRGDHHGAVMEVGRVDDDSVKLIDPVREGLAIIGDLPGAFVALGDFGESGLIDVAEPGELDHGMAFEALALEVPDPVDADLEDAQFAVFVGRCAHRGGVRDEGGGTKDGGRTEEVTSRRRRGDSFGIHGRGTVSKQPFRGESLFLPPFWSVGRNDGRAGSFRGAADGNTFSPSLQTPRQAGQARRQSVKRKTTPCRCWPPGSRGDRPARLPPCHPATKVARVSAGHPRIPRES